MIDVKVIILSPNSLSAIGLRSVLATTFGIDAIIGDNDYFDGFHPSREPDFFFVDDSTLIGNLSFFLPRKVKTIVLTSNGKTVEDFKTLDTDASENIIIDNLSAIIKQDKPEEKNTTSALSHREIEVLRLVASGRINKEIAQELNISINTVLSHRKNLTSKLGIKSVSGLSFYAMMNGIV